MHEPTDRYPAGDRQPGGAERPSTRPVPGIVRRIGRPFGWRHVKGVALTRLLVAIWLVCLGIIFCSLGYWEGVFFFLAAAPVGALAYLMPRWKLTLEAAGVQTPWDDSRSSR
jgi:hypothetical protein